MSLSGSHDSRATAPARPRNRGAAAGPGPYAAGHGTVPRRDRRALRARDDEAQRITHGLGQLELLRTREIIRRHLPPGPQRILDVGGGTGIHAAWLADDGHHVHLIDPIRRHVEQARRHPASRGSITAELGDARDLRAARASFDAVLLLGPLYHLTEGDDRIRALREAARVLGPGGVTFVAAISRFASLFDGLADEFLFDPDFRPIVERDLHEGQ